MLTSMEITVRDHVSKGLTYEEIARRMSISMDAVRGAYWRGNRKLNTGVKTFKVRFRKWNPAGEEWELYVANFVGRSKAAVNQTVKANHKVAGKYPQIISIVAP